MLATILSYTPENNTVTVILDDGTIVSLPAHTVFDNLVGQRGIYEGGILALPPQAQYFEDTIGAHGIGQTVPATSTYAMIPFVTGVQSTLFNYPWPTAGTLKKCYFRISGAQPASGSLVVTLLINNTPSDISIEIPANSPAEQYTDLIHTAELAAGDFIRWEVVNNASAPSATISGVSTVLKQTVTY